MRLRVALPCSGLGHVRRGYERFTEEVGRALANEAPDLETKVYGARTPRGAQGGSLPCLRRGWLEALGLNWSAAYRIEQFSFAASLVPILVAHRFDVVHASDPALCSALLHARDSLRLRFRIVFCNSGPIGREHWSRFDHIQLVVPWQLDEALASGIPPDQVTYLPMGIAPAAFRARQNRDSARAALGLPKEGLVLISVAALNSTHKRLDYVISEIGRADPLWSLVCVGQETEETPSLVRLADEVAPGRVIFRSASADAIPTYLAASDVLTLASRNEGFGLAMLEGLAAGLPVISRDVPTLRYLVDDDEQLFPLLEPGELAAALRRLTASERRARLGARNRDAVAQRFDWSVLVPQYVDMYRRSIQRSSRLRFPSGKR